MMYFSTEIVLTILLIVLCGKNQGHVEQKSAKQGHHRRSHRHHNLHKSQTRFAPQEENVDKAYVQHTNSHKDQVNTGEVRGLYFVARLDESPEPKATIPLQRRRRDASGNNWAATGGGVAPTITTLAVQTNIGNRFSTTDVKSIIHNIGDVDKEASFVVQIPEKSYISNFTMLINEKLFIGEVKEKEVAEKEYEAAKRRKETAGKVSSVSRSVVQPARGMEVFSVAVNIAASSSVEFVLSYQQLLERKLGVYKQVISVRPNQVVDNLSVLVKITDSQDIKFVNFSLNGTQPSGALLDFENEQTKKITYSPSKEAQEEMDPVKGLNGDMIITYDVAHSPRDAGMVCIDGDYFIHYFSPTGLQPLNKNVVFVIDTSGSMAGNKIKQTLTAMKAILDILRPGDRFKFILFHTTLNYWPKQEGLIPATLDNIYSAKKFLEGELKATGSTNINDALVEACRTLNSESQYGSNTVVFLTDGQPTTGETNPDKIVTNVVREAANRVSVFSLGFGSKYELDFNLLKKISYRTGVAEGAIRIYPGLEADEQLKQFFILVNTPLLFNVKVEYPIDIVIIDTVTQNEFPQYFNGSEIVIAGKLNPNRIDKRMSVVVGGVATMEVKYEKEVDLSASCPVVTRGYVQKLYAYMKIKYLLIQAEKTDSTSMQQQIKQDALQLALEYNLVTPLTSMVIIQQVPEAGNFYIEEDKFVNVKASFITNSSSSRATLSTSLFMAFIFSVSFMLVL